jgi:hypothetical protein
VTQVCLGLGSSTPPKKLKPMSYSSQKVKASNLFESIGCQKIILKSGS